MTKRFGVRKIKVGSYSRQGWFMSERESFAVYDRKWKEVARANGRTPWDGGKNYMYVQYTEFNNKDFVKAVADYLNQTIGDDVNKRIDGFCAYNEVLRRDIGHNELNNYAEWCNKFSTGFRPTTKFQKV